MISFKKSLYSALVFFGTLTALTIGYSNYITSLPASVGSGSGLTAGEWNKMVTSLSQLDTTLTNSNLTFSGGKVGIGTVNPGDKLDVTGGNIRNFNGAGGGIDFKRTSDGWNPGSIIVSQDSAYMGTMSFKQNTTNASTDAPTTTMTLYRGNVGIGTVSPGNYKLYINDTSSNALALNAPTTPVQRFQVWGADIWGFLGNYASPSGLSIYNYNNTSVAMQFTSAGNVGIGTATVTSGFKMEVAGAIKSNGADSYTSDVRFKKHIQPLENALDKITSLNGVSFDWRNDEFSDKNFKKTKDIGVIAQNVEKAFPELVTTGDDGYKSVAYTSLVAPLIEAVKELSHKIDTLFVKYFDQQKEIDSLKQENKDIKSLLCLDHPTAEICK